MYDQTVERTRQTLQKMTVYGKADLQSGNAVQPAYSCVVVATKNVKVLARLRSVLASAAWSGRAVMIIDDEADQASLDTRMNTPANGPSGVNREISAIRRACPSHAFLQTTATPQALLLQDPASPYRPDFVHVTTPGAAYCGGELFFIREDFLNPQFLRFVPPVDVVILRNRGVLPHSLIEAVYSFFVAAALLRLQGNGQNFQALIHTSLKKAEHALVSPLVRSLHTVIANGLQASPVSPNVQQELQNAYANFVVPSSGPTFSDVLKEVQANLASTEIVETNSSTGQGVQPTPNRRHIIYIGGTKLGRGVTIKNLIMTYYARDAQSPQSVLNWS